MRCKVRMSGWVCGPVLYMRSRGQGKGGTDGPSCDGVRADAAMSKDEWCGVVGGVCKDDSIQLPIHDIYRYIDIIYIYAWSSVAVRHA